jgi:hypothetical protein
MECAHTRLQLPDPVDRVASSIHVRPPALLTLISGFINFVCTSLEAGRDDTRTVRLNTGGAGPATLQSQRVSCQSPVPHALPPVSHQVHRLPHHLSLSLPQRPSIHFVMANEAPEAAMGEAAAPAGGGGEGERMTMVVGVDESEPSAYALQWTLRHFFPPNQPPQYRLLVVTAKHASVPAVGPAGPGTYGLLLSSSPL